MSAFAAKKKVSSPESVMNAFAKGKKEQKATPTTPSTPATTTDTAATVTTATTAVNNAVASAGKEVEAEVAKVTSTSSAATPQSVVNAFSKGVKKA